MRTLWKVTLHLFALIGLISCLAAATYITLPYATRAKHKASALSARLRHHIHKKANKIRSHRTVSDRLKEHGPKARKTLHTLFKNAHAPYPPTSITLAAFKRERRLEVYAPNHNGHPTLITTYPILGASGHLGPKLKRGDKQVPEGIYSINFLNPNSSNHLSMRINYPNPQDRAQARREKRRDLGHGIFIHGKTTSAGCLAMGDPNIEELFTLVADTGKSNTSVIIAPLDLRRFKRLPKTLRKQPKWVQKRYKTIKKALPPRSKPNS